MRIFLAGATGQIGLRLVAQLRQRGDQPVLLTRNAARARQRLGDGFEFVEGDPRVAGPWMKQVAGCDSVVNLVGENLFAKRWSESFKNLLRESRLESTQMIVQAIREAGSKPRVLVNASAIGYYGYHGDEVITEESPPGDDFLAKMCVEWEAAAKPAQDLGVRLVLLRTGIVLDKEGGALKMMSLPFKLILFGGPVGSGKQYVSWIHHADEVGILLLGLDNPQAKGPLNATAPVPVTNKELAQAIGTAMGRPSFMPTPAFMLKLGLGGASELVTKGAKVLPRKAQELGYAFRFPEIGGALKDIFGN